MAKTLALSRLVVAFLKFLIHVRSPSNPGGTGGAGKGFVLERAEGYSRILKVQLVQPVSLEAFDDVPLVPFLFQQFNLFGLYRESLHRCSSSSKSENKTVVEMTSSFACLCRLCMN